MVVLLYQSGIPVMLTEKFSKIQFDIEGFLIKFTFKESETTEPIKYRFYYKSEFKTNDKKRSDLTDGFYNETQYLKYIENTGPNIPLGADMIFKFKFNFEKFIAKPNDPISVSVTNFDAPYDFFYNRKKYDFIVEKNIDQKGVRSYAESITEGFEKIDYKLRLPSNYTSSTIPVTITSSNRPGSYFYAKNLGDFINQYTNNAEKRRLKKIILLIIFKIREIVDEIVPILLNNETSEATIEATVNNIDTDLNDLTNLEKLVLLMKKSWGYYFDPNSTLPHRSSFPTIFNQQSSYSDFESYYLGLVSFYNKSYRTPHSLSTFEENLKYEFLLLTLPINALSIVPIEVLKSIIEYFIKKLYLEEYEKRFVANIIFSIPSINADLFLDYLSISYNGVNTIYEGIYSILGDARIERYNIAKSIADEIPTRRKMVFAVYELWKVSKYNFFHIPNGVIPIFENINPNAFFIQNPTEYQTNNILNFTSNYFSSSEGFTIKGFEYNAKFINNKINIGKKETIISQKYQYIDDGYGAPAVHPELIFKPDVKIGDFHIYHPISLIGIQPDSEVILPESSHYPAFIFQYIKEFEDLKEFDALVNLGITITIELALAYFTGGISSLKYLNYLKSTSRIYRALTNSALAGEQILILTGLETASNVIAVSGSILYAYNQYLIQISNDPSKIEELEKLNSIIFWLILAQAAASFTFSYKAINAADEFLDVFPLGSVPTEVETLLSTLKNQKPANILGIREKIINLGFEENNILIKFDNVFATDVKIAFWDDFKNLSKEEWKIINKSNALENWKYLYDKKITDRKFINILINNTKVNAIARFYEHPPLSNFLESLTPLQRWRFLDKHGKIEQDILIHLIDNPKGIILLDQASTSLTTIPDYLSILDVKKILRSGVSEDIISFTIKRQRLNWDISKKMFENNINLIPITNNELRNFHTNFSESFIGLPKKILNKFSSRNRINARISCYNEGHLVEPISTEWYISGEQIDFDDIFKEESLSILKERFIQPSNIEKYKAFAMNALDDVGTPRINDTEVKFLFNFFENHYNKGNKFVIEIESTLYTCTSCQKYLQVAQELAESQGKILEIKFIAHKKAKTMEALKDLIKQ